MSRSHLKTIHKIGTDHPRCLSSRKTGVDAILQPSPNREINLDWSQNSNKARSMCRVHHIRILSQSEHKKGENEGEQDALLKQKTTLRKMAKA